MRGRIAAVLWVMAVAASAFGLYLVKYRVQAVREEITETARLLEEERESLHVVAAEWSYLTRPERIQQLAEKHLQMTPMQVQQLQTLADIPYTPGVTPAEEQVIPASIGGAR